MSTKRKHRTNTPKPRYVKPALELTLEDHLEAMRVMALANTIRDTLERVPWFQGKFITATDNYLYALNKLLDEMATERDLWNDLNLVYTEFNKVPELLLQAKDGKMFLNELIIKPDHNGRL